MAITHVGSAEGNGNPTLDPTVNIPANDPGDVAFAWFASRGTDPDPPSTVTDNGSAGVWNKIADNSPTSVLSTLSMWSRVTASGDDNALVTADGGHADGS